MKEENKMKDLMIKNPVGYVYYIMTVNYLKEKIKQIQREKES